MIKKTLICFLYFFSFLANSNENLEYKYTDPTFFVVEKSKNNYYQVFYLNEKFKFTIDQKNKYIEHAFSNSKIKLIIHQDSTNNVDLFSVDFSYNSKEPQTYVFDKQKIYFPETYDENMQIFFKLNLAEYVMVSLYY